MPSQSVCRNTPVVSATPSRCLSGMLARPAGSLDASERREPSFAGWLGGLGGWMGGWVGGRIVRDHARAAHFDHVLRCKRHAWRQRLFCTSTRAHVSMSVFFVSRAHYYLCKYWGSQCWRALAGTHRPEPRKDDNTLAEEAPRAEHTERPRPNQNSEGLGERCRPGGGLRAADRRSGGYIERRRHVAAMSDSARLYIDVHPHVATLCADKEAAAYHECSSVEAPAAQCGEMRGTRREIMSMKLRPPAIAAVRHPRHWQSARLQPRPLLASPPRLARHRPRGLSPASAPPRLGCVCAGGRSEGRGSMRGGLCLTGGSEQEDGLFCSPS